MDFKSVISHLFLGFLILKSAAAGTTDHESGYGEGRLNPFLEILEAENVTGSQILPFDKLEDFIKEVFQHFKCDHSSNSTNRNQQTTRVCNQALCVNTTELLHLVELDRISGITDDEFENVSLVLLYIITQIKTVCRSYADLSTLTLDGVRGQLVSLSGGVSTGHPHFHEAELNNLLNNFKDSISHENHDHNKDDHVDHDHDHDHQHDNQVEGHDHVHDNTKEGHDHDLHNLVVKEKCMSGDALMYFLGEEHSVDLDRFGDLTSIIVYFIYKGYDVQEKCRLLPYKEEFVNNLMAKFGVQGNMTAAGLMDMMTKLGINPETGAHDDHAAGEHTHSHEKRSIAEHRASKTGDLTELIRDKRQAVNQANVQQCFTANQIMAIHDAQDSIGPVQFQQMCPALINQKLFAECGQASTSESTQKPTQAEMYGYASLATAIICLCSVFGVVFIPCLSKTVYSIIMSLFVGLAVGTLFSDAVLHLIPSALGVHTHDEHHEHAHGDEIMVETYVLFGLAIMAGLYFFYILETMMSKCGGHSHSHDSEEADEAKYSNNHVMTTTFEDERELTKEKSAKSYVVHADSPGLMPDQKPSKRTCGLTPVALMIILGDGIHNFADGLAIGASFTGGIATGIATSIAVFCHELPHELGDFAVLLESGLGFKKALLLNLASSLTAFAGLYVSLSVTTGEEAQRWIFAVTSGMFLYIALVDLLPQLIKTSSVLHFVLNNIGILVGFAIMLVIAVFEEHIKI